MTNAPIDILRIRINYFSHCPDHYPRQWLSLILMPVNIQNICQRCGPEHRVLFVEYFPVYCPISRIGRFPAHWSPVPIPKYVF